MSKRAAQLLAIAPYRRASAPGLIYPSRAASGARAMPTHINRAGMEAYVDLVGRS
jgi:hypothetical protein